MQYAQQTNIKVLIGDSSVRSRLVLAGMIDAEPGLEVVDTAQTKEELVHKANLIQPDMIVVQADFLQKSVFPYFKVVYRAGKSLLLLPYQQDSIYSFSYTGMPKASMNYDSDARGRLYKDEFRKELLLTIKAYAGKEKSPQLSPASFKQKDFLITSHSREAKLREEALSLVVIGASTGGSKAIEMLIKDLDVNGPTIILIALHMPEKFSHRFAKRLQKHTHWRVVEGHPGMELTSHTIVVAPGGSNMRVKKNSLRKGKLKLDLTTTEVMTDTPSVNVLMKSAADCAGNKVLGVILTGMGTDGTEGSQEIVRQGGKVIAQDEASSTIFGMAHSVIKSGVVSGVYPLQEIPNSIRRFVAERSMGFALESDLIG